MVLCHGSFPFLYDARGLRGYEGVYFIQDLIGMRVFDVDNKDIYYGKVVDVLQPGANDVYRIVDDNCVDTA